jgi:hypothetical protein
MFEIQFQGLIAHARVADSNTGITHQVAVLIAVKDNPHVPLLTIRDGEGSTTDEDPVGTGEDGTKCYRLKGSITLDLPPGLPDQYLSDVPSLSRLSTGRKVKASIGNRTTDECVSTYVTVEKGTMFIGDWFNTKAVFSGGTSVCVPRTVVYAVNAEHEVKLSMRYQQKDGRFKTSLFKLKKEASIRISNVEKTVNNSVKHFRNYTLIFDPQNAATIVEPAATAEPCEIKTSITEIKKCAESAHMSVECTNTTFP